MMSWEDGYDQGYYEGIRNVVAVLITRVLNGDPVQDIITGLAELRENAKPHRPKDP